MKRYALALALCLAAFGASAKGVPFALPSLERAQEATKQDASRHTLVFYTSEA